MNSESIIKAKLIATCGMNCAICSAYILRKKINVQNAMGVMIISHLVVLDVELKIAKILKVVNQIFVLHVKNTLVHE